MSAGVRSMLAFWASGAARLSAAQSASTVPATATWQVPDASGTFATPASAIWTVPDVTRALRPLDLQAPGVVSLAPLREVQPLAPSRDSMPLEEGS
jgi:hypothetical protein